MRTTLASLLCGLQLAVALRSAAGSVARRTPPLVLRGGASSMSFGHPLTAYAAALTAQPILTKALTSGVLFGLSDVCAQGIAPSHSGKRDWVRTVVAAAVGLLYFGPAAHYWYEMVSHLFPKSGWLYTLLKTALGQSIFGPIFTCIFFAATLVATSGLSAGLSAWPNKVRADLLPTQLAGMGFWPIVDVVSYGFIPVMWIPLFVNSCSFVWTIFLSLQAARGVSKTSE